MPKRNRDILFTERLNQLTDFEFNDQVVAVFEDMINRSVPGYGTVVHSLSHFARQYAKENTSCYDLGCSLGASSIAMLQGIRHKQTKVISVDNSHEMIERAKGLLSDIDEYQQVTLQQQDVLETNIDNASLVAMNFLLQFIPPEKRDALLQAIFDGMNSGACLVLSEKVRFENLAIHQNITNLHHRFKAEQGYTELEIAQKRDSLENVMKLDTQTQHIDRLLSVGFSEVQQWYQNTAFVSFYAIK